MATPVITVLTAEPSQQLPGFQPGGRATLHFAHDLDTLRDGLERSDILVVTDFRSTLLHDTWPADCPVRWVHATSAGVDALRIPAQHRSDLTVTNARGVFDRGIAEYVLGAILMFAKDTLGNLAHQRSHRWQHRDTALISRQRALIVGAGSIGRETGRLLKAAGLQITGTARSTRDDPVFGKVFSVSELPRLLPDADHVVITAPLTSGTDGLFDDAMLRHCKPGACLINVGRGPIVRTHALIKALQSGRLQGAALDVFEQEPLPADHPLWDMPQVMISAHMAGDFVGWEAALGEQFSAQLDRYLSGAPLENIVRLDKH
jgi:phosphoglycerate dehydrogenase-like enzyme